MAGAQAMTQGWDFVDASILWQQQRPSILDERLRDQELSVLVINALYNYGDTPIETVGQLITHTEAELLRYAKFGRRSLNEVKAFLHKHGLVLGSADCVLVGRTSGDDAKEGWST
jgi:DNA-directed RNA polymerase alpha subunit